MTKRLLAAILVATLTVGSFVGCGTSGGTNGSTDESAKTQADDTKKEDKKAAKKTKTVTDNVIANELFEITIPDEVTGKFEAEVSDDRIDIYHKASKDGTYGGLVFSIWAVELPKKYAGGPYVKIGELSNSDAVIYDMEKGEATEIQTDLDKEDVAKEYNGLYDSAEKVMESIKGVNGFTYIAGAGTKGEDLYNNVLAKYVTAVNEEWDSNKCEAEEISPEIGAIIAADDRKALDEIGFAYADSNVDGIEELFVGVIGDAEGIAYDIYTVVDSKPAHVISGTARDRYYNYDNVFIANEYSGGANESGWNVYGLSANDTELIYQWGFKYDGYEDEKKPWFKTYDGKEYEPVTQEEFEKAQEDNESKYVRFEYTPLSKNENAVAAAE